MQADADLFGEHVGQAAIEAGVAKMLGALGEEIQGLARAFLEIQHAGMGQGGADHMTGYREAQHLACLVDAVLFVKHLGHHHGAGAGADRASAIQLLGFQQRRGGDPLGLQHRAFEQGDGDQAGTTEQSHFFVVLTHYPAVLREEQAARLGVASQAVATRYEFPATAG
ncbi:hypothetical protein D3C81_1487940 [compost metagenome]